MREPLFRETVFELASAGDPAALWHLAHNHYFLSNKAAKVSGLALQSLNLAKIDANISSCGYKPPKKSDAELSIFV